MWRHLVLLALVGCSSPAISHPFDEPPASMSATRATVAPTYDFEATWSESERSAILAGFEEWPDTIHATLHVWRVTKLEPHAEICPTFDSVPGHSFEGYTVGDHDMCFYTFEIPEHGGLEHDAAHEYGHALGLGHYVGYEPSIMFADVDDQSATVQSVDLDDLRGVLTAPR